MPSPKHKCAHPDCNKLISAKAKHCRNHVPHTRKWIEKQAAAQHGKSLTDDHRRKISLARSGQVKTQCHWCGKTFLVKPSRLKKGQGKYCSNKCNYAARTGENSPLWNGGPSEYSCDQCGKVFIRQSCQVKGEHVFCSYSCSSIYRKAKQNNSATIIERLIAEALTAVGLYFRNQEPLCNSTIADFYLPEHKIAIFCDGNYWHNYPHGKPRDLEQTAILEQNGITVFRFWGSEIHENAQRCVEKVKNFIVSN